ncbi:hypothetical protein B0T19DRAFT_236648 [Cercophora scortea]|uniref:Uncharacterized protein n=1 Tax=Cercophora scortea TaxID=314031 RepID=A0AAE0MB82_9PEZI|nr:hypothetical protein B0T19DRAFT_236648 [Cercophora scortea]
MSDTAINLQEIHDTLVAIAFEAGRMIMAANPSDISTGTKMNCMCCLCFHFSPHPMPPLLFLLFLLHRSPFLVSRQPNMI